LDLIGEIPPSHAWEALGFPAGLNAYLDWLEKRGARELLWTPEPSALAAVTSALSGRGFALTAVLPNMSLYARDALDSGPVGAVLKRLKALSPVRFLELGFRLLPRAPALLGKRFSAGALLLAEAEFMRLAALPVTKVVLHNSVVDMAAAFGCREMFDEFLAWARGRGVEGLFMTNNLGLWASRTKEWGMDGLVAVAPVNEKGYLMQPDRAAVEAYCRAHPGDVWAIETGGSAHLESLGIARAVIPWGDYRPETPASRLAVWKKRIDSFPGV
jgi:hypothetical protein